MSVARSEFRIDGKKLRDAIYEKNLNYVIVGEKFGFSDCWMANYVRRNTIPSYAVTLLETIGIPFDRYKVEDVSEAEEKANKKAPCHYCGGDGDLITVSNIVDGKFNISAVICASRKTISFGGFWGSEEIASDTFFVNYCPCCGRKL